MKILLVEALVEGVRTLLVEEGKLDVELRTRLVEASKGLEMVRLEVSKGLVKGICCLQILRRRSWLVYRRWAVGRAVAAASSADCRCGLVKEGRTGSEVRHDVVRVVGSGTLCSWIRMSLVKGSCVLLRGQSLPAFLRAY